MKKIIFAVFILTTLYLILDTSLVFASLKINEIYPAPSLGEYEWVEIYNDENIDIDLSQYSITDSTNKKIKFTNIIIPPLSFEIATASGVLNNNDGDTVFLKNILGEIIEIATYSASFDSTKTYTKCPNGNGSWFVLNTLTKNYSNETACQILTPTLEPILTLTPTLIIVPMERSEDPTPIASPEPTAKAGTTPTSTLIPIDNIYISEVMANPPIGEKEWVEIYNDNDFSVSLNNWYIDDLENGGSTPKIFSLEIGAKSYGVFGLTSSMFNNEGDSVRLLDFNKNIKDDFEYSKNGQGKSLGRTRIDSDDFCLQEPSKNSANNSCINSEPTITSSTSIKQTNLSPTINNVSSKTLVNKANNFDVSIHRSVNYPTGIILKNFDRGEILGATEELITGPPDNGSLIDLLTILSVSYSLLTIGSILFKMKLSYGKDKNFYSSAFRPPRRKQF